MRDIYWRTHYLLINFSWLSHLGGKVCRERWYLFIDIWCYKNSTTINLGGSLRNFSTLQHPNFHVSCSPSTRLKDKNQPWGDLWVILSCPMLLLSEGMWWHKQTSQRTWPPLSMLRTLTRRGLSTGLQWVTMITPSPHCRASHCFPSWCFCEKALL